MLCRTLLTMLLLTANMVGQDMTDKNIISEQEAREHLITHPAPIDPPIAMAAQISGEVRLAVTVESDGTVSGVKTLSGPPMLVGAATDAVKKWFFSPFKKAGEAMRVSTEVNIPFSLPKPPKEETKAQMQAAQDYFPLEDKCRSALKGTDHTAAVLACKQAQEMALAAGDTTNSDQLSLMDAHETYGHALLDAGQLREAFAEENAAIEIAKKCLTNVDQEYGMPFYWKAMVEAALHQPDATFADMNIAEDSQRRAIQNLPDMKPMYSHYLAIMLKRHAEWLDQMGRSEEANKLRAEAASL